MKKHGHYCKVCGEYKASEKFSGKGYAAHILEKGGYKKLVSSRYVNDKQITDHYAIIPTGQGLSALKGVSEGLQNVYEIIVRRFLSIYVVHLCHQRKDRNK